MLCISLAWPNGPRKGTNEKSPGSSTVVGPNPTFCSLHLITQKAFFPSDNEKIIPKANKNSGTNNLMCSCGISFANINLV